MVVAIFCWESVQGSRICIRCGWELGTAGAIMYDAQGKKKKLDDGQVQLTLAQGCVFALVDMNAINVFQCNVGNLLCFS